MDLSNENVIHVVDGKIEYLQFRRLLEYPHLVHAFALKPLDFRVRGGVDSTQIPESYETFLNALGLTMNSLVRPNQMHTNHVIAIHEKERKDGPDIFLDYLKNVDGTMTSQKGITLASTNADCIVLLLYDPVKQVIASIHSGWRGTFQKIAAVTVQKMRAEYGCEAKDIVACICPSIRKCHFEVDEDVKLECEKIFEYTGKLNEIIAKGELKEGKQKYLIDTIFITKILLEEEGWVAENIIDSGICSVCASEKVHSRRADGEKYGLGAGIISLK